jgi:hypothetical protein
MVGPQTQFLFSSGSLGKERDRRSVVRSEREKMLAGELYDPMDAELVAGRNRARDLCQDLNATREAEHEERRRLLRALFGAGGETVWMQRRSGATTARTSSLGSASSSASPSAHRSHSRGSHSRAASSSFTAQRPPEGGRFCHFKP